ncbi:TPA: hypothetical protein MIH72_12380 [Klebsiella pneumoniae]|nr:hypothetical protein E3U38_19380 [Klebsiella pneumoniae subsp. pneumoniae]HBX8227804.1 hypothetical protein [Klebsiella pneumoniae]HBX8257523.1 hypothetical protein [Klebsiella pneumoniae]
METGKNGGISAASPASSPGRAALTGASNRIPDRSPDKALRAAIRGGWGNCQPDERINNRRGPAQPPGPAARRPSRNGCCGCSG